MIYDPIESGPAEFCFKSADGLSIWCARWDGHGPVRGIVQIAHGMGEHMGRYRDTIAALTTAGFTVYGNDHRGHGRSAASEAGFGHFGVGGFDLLVEDMHRLSQIARGDSPGLPFILLGHSMGSFAAQQYALEHSRELDGLILSGSGDLYRLAQLASAAWPATDVLNRSFEPARTPFDWLNRDNTVVDAFITDPLCFAQLEPSSLASFLAAGRRLADPRQLRAIRDDLHIYIFSGSDDPVGQGLMGVQTLIDRYRHAGILALSKDYYLGGRHEMLNEINRDEVRARLIRWLSRLLDSIRVGATAHAIA